MAKMSQKKAVLKHLQTFGELSSWQATTDYKITRLSAIIYDLREEGYKITSKRYTSVTRNIYGNYSHYCIYYYDKLDGTAI